jgi:inhibitor of the pro-sigma K processing machinery
LCRRFTNTQEIFGLFERVHAYKKTEVEILYRSFIIIKVIFSTRHPSRSDFEPMRRKENHMDALSAAITIIIVVAALFIFFKLISKPIRLILRLLFNTLLGFVTLFLLNFFGSYIGISIGLNWLNAVVVGVFGLPGLAVLLVLKWLLII